MEAINWNQCLTALKADLPEKEFNTWVRPLHAIEVSNGLKLLAPNRFAVDWVNAHLLPRILDLLSQDAISDSLEIHVEIGSRDSAPVCLSLQPPTVSQTRAMSNLVPGARLHADWTFKNFIRGRSNALAYDAAFEIAMKPGHAFNPGVLPNKQRLLDRGLILKAQIHGTQKSRESAKDLAFAQLIATA